MNVIQFQSFATKCFTKQMDVNKLKCHDYADEDVLSNFKRVAKICKLINLDVHTAEGVAMFFIIHKLDRENNLKAKGNASCESREDTMEVDLPNYVRLYNALRKEGDND